MLGPNDKIIEAKRELREIFKGLERLRVGQPRPDKPVYVREGDHLSVLIPPRKLTVSKD